MVKITVGKDLDRWIVRANGRFIDSITTKIPKEKIKDYVEYLEGWFETHDEGDPVSYFEYYDNDRGEIE